MFMLLSALVCFAQNTTFNLENSIFNDTQQIDWEPYVKQFSNQAKNNWNPPVSKGIYRIIVIVRINKKGEIIDTTITKSSGIKEADEAVLESVINAGPYQAPPSYFKGDVLPVELVFEHFSDVQKR